jgi:Xaa-Pro aminopeptidase
MTLLQEKVEQAIDILKEKDVDMWLTFVRETSAVRDPMMDYLLGSNDLTWPSALILVSSGRRTAIVGRFEAESVRRTGIYEQVIAYDESIRPALLEVLNRYKPRCIAINTSRDEVHADGLTHGSYELLASYLEGTSFAGKFSSAENIISALRGRKIPAEVECIRAAVRTTLEIYRRTFEFVCTGMTEKTIGDFMHGLVAELGVSTAWSYEGCPAVNSGPKSSVGHGGPTEIRVEPGHLLHFDFGVRQDGYCSDIQRMAYVLRPGEKEPPGIVQRGFETVRTAIEAARTVLKPGTTGIAVDQAARRVITDAGYPEFKYATGHQLGRIDHDGGTLLGPAWERYGDTPLKKVEEGHVYTLEPGLAVEGYGYIGLEEDVLVTGKGAEYLGEPQQHLVLIKRYE